MEESAVRSSSDNQKELKSRPPQRVNLKDAVRDLSEKVRARCLKRAKLQRESLLQSKRDKRGPNQQTSEKQLRQTIREEFDLEADIEIEREIYAFTPELAFDFESDIDNEIDLEADIEIEREVYAYTPEELSAAYLALEEELYSSLIAAELENIEAEAERGVQQLVEDFETLTLPHPGREGGDCESNVLCPVCGRDYLVLLHGTVACPSERWQLDVRTESISLEHLRDRLAEAYNVHTASCTSGRLQFRIQEQFGSTNLTATCDSCGLLHIVV
eukprot:gene27150-2383_t